MTSLTETAVVTIEEITPNGASDYVHGGNVDSPRGGVETYGMTIEGWVLSRQIPIEHVEVLYEERPLATVPVDRPRPDIAAGFPEVEGASRSGFLATISALRLPERFELVLRAKLVDGTRLPLANLRGRRRRLPAGGGGEIQPLMVNTIGRSGSTLLVTLLSSHPDVVAFAPFIKDARISTYWVNVLQDLAAPSSYLAPFDPPDLERPHWWLDGGGGELGDEEVERWLGSGSVDSLAGLCRTQIEAFYSNLAAGGARFFVEKYLPYQVVPDLLGELYAGAREVILVRDFRDMLCSVIAFNRKRGWSDFGHTEGGDDAKYVREVMLPSLTALARRLQREGAAPSLVRYEDLVLDPEPALAGLFAQLGLQSGEEVVAETVRLAHEGTASMDHHRTTSDPAASIGRWRDDLPDDIAAVCNEELGPLLAEFGYEAS
ncbi:MAG TPA: sulfotransferase [Solirubrobacterales bacterium]|nr:sulfotransferase [Solirubrobacterales bacterium]